MSHPLLGQDRFCPTVKVLSPFLGSVMLSVSLLSLSYELTVEIIKPPKDPQDVFCYSLYLEAFLMTFLSKIGRWELCGMVFFDLLGRFSACL